MPRIPHRAFEIARVQLESALYLYYEKADFVSAVTLAGVADVIVGRHLRNMNRETALDHLATAIKDIEELFEQRCISEKEAISEANFARDRIKHIDPSKVPGFIMDAKQEATSMIRRAISNWKDAKLPLSELMRRFVNDEAEV